PLRGGRLSSNPAIRASLASTERLIERRLRAGWYSGLEARRVRQQRQHFHSYFFYSFSCTMRCQGDENPAAGWYICLPPRHCGRLFHGDTKMPAHLGVNAWVWISPFTTDESLDLID